jgi:hypothetical protein
MLGFLFAAALFYTVVYLPLAAFTAGLTVVPDTPLEIAVMLVGSNVALMVIGRSVVREREERAARDGELYGRTDIHSCAPSSSFPSPAGAWLDLDGGDREREAYERVQEAAARVRELWPSRGRDPHTTAELRAALADASEAYWKLAEAWSERNRERKKPDAA